VSDTPRTDGLKFLPANAIMSGLPVVYADFAHQLERELAAVTAERDALKKSVCLNIELRKDWQKLCEEAQSHCAAWRKNYFNLKAMADRHELIETINAAKGVGHE
jgi:hypothetical protein